MVNPQILREILSDFYDRVFKDTMISFYFKGKDKERLIEKEMELTLALLGEKVKYTGKPLKSSHFPHKILGGHFDRRTQILKEVIGKHSLPPEIAEAWIEHTLALRDQITKDAPGECAD
ncbi:hypothetical protein HOF92_16320 [bacterium]|jgi:hemoglobin|nr:hypothetical protein [bacterium]